MINIEKVTPTGLFTNYIYKAIPLAFDESMSYYETLCGLLSYLKDTVIPALNNNADAIVEVQALMTQLQNYVDNYFNNLDVTEEINNKLDSMVEDGTLTTLIGNYCDPLINEQNEKINAQDTKIETLENGVSTNATNISNEITNRQNADTSLQNNINAESNTRNNADIDLQNQINSLASGSPKGVYATTSALVSANPDTGVYIVSDDGHIYSWTKNGDSAIDLGVYQASEDSDSIINLQNDVNDLKNGLEVLPSDYERGNLNSDGTVNSSIEYRVYTPDFMKFDKDTELYIASGIYMAILQYDSNKENPVRTGAITNSYIVPENTWFKICLLRVNEDTGEVADLTVWREYVKIKTKIEERFEQIENDIDDIIEVVGEIPYLNGNFTRGNLNTDGVTINTDVQYRVASTSFMKYIHNLNVEVQAGFQFALFTFDNNKENPVRTGGIQGSYTIPANTYFKVCILRVDENTSEIANIDEFVRSILIINNNIDQRVTKLETSPLKNKKIGFLGDSIVGTDYTTPTWWQMIATKTGMIPTNYGVSGTSIAYNAERETTFGHCISERYADMSNNLDGVVIMGGTNDRGESPIGSWNDNTINTLYGALNILLTGLLDKYPGKPIIFCTPIPRANTSYSTQDYVLDPISALSNKTSTDTLSNQLITQAIKSKCEQYGIQYIDMSTCGINGVDTEKVYYRPDDTWHPSQIGQKAIANYVINRIEQSFIF